MTSTALKLLALGLMLLDHMYVFLPRVPIWFTYLGRLSAPLFFFCMCWGLHHTKNRGKYLRNLYLCGVFMAVGSVCVALLVKRPGEPLLFNIFVTLFLVGVIASVGEAIQKGDKKTARKWITQLLFVQIVGTLAVVTALILYPESNVFLIPAALFPNLLFCEGGFLWVCLGGAMYFLKAKKLWLGVVYGAFCLLHLSMGGHQWLMVFALPLLLSYNGEKGRGLKWLFYIFYPVHIYALYWIGGALGG